ncbi:hypothetical protein F5888DRAFT_1602364 [Russula emetica]|nr:hypothetical protein F5888DRAFT_1602364 [Russula emetica]
MNKHARPDISIKDADGLISLVQEDKSHLNPVDPSPQLIAQAIAAFVNNNVRRHELHWEPHAHAIIPGITMTGTTPTFYKIPVTTELVHAVRFGIYPEQETIIPCHRPAIPILAHGMQNLDDRHLILSSFAAFRSLFPNLFPNI